LFREFEFLKKLKKVPVSTQWTRIRGSFDLQMISQVLMDPQNYHFDTFDYGPVNAKSPQGGAK
jgi:hypothetical protein